MTRGLISPVYGFGADGARETRGERRRMRPVPVPVDVLEGLQPAARERGISVPELAQRLLETISAEKMVTAVLDDEADGKPRGRYL
ncbi:hypothetical protein [Parvibaculum sp.]|uniref:hypothetical protein n=1 Tax=Parvibaculum sp. TaxID=2024848 RepID=UPI000C6279EC|nr:hypothetical protein [Parvibaculum sp.]MAM95693.1 hypothetical protein [Parvibaculum sp.]HCX68557.1 hypothetical protein [Rhodobiaceae bacterium]|tara:strand:- start:21393 stop:21650 length:258 start_codon:yes stop_codon:yes gene_type:complete